MNADEVFDRSWPLIDAVPGWLSPGQERALFDLAWNTSTAGRLLELGSFLGRSTVSLAAACSNTGRRVYCNRHLRLDQRCLCLITCKAPSQFAPFIKTRSFLLQLLNEQIIIIHLYL